jgi:hypothetical protein
VRGWLLWRRHHRFAATRRAWRNTLARWGQTFLIIGAAALAGSMVVGPGAARCKRNASGPLDRRASFYGWNRILVEFRADGTLTMNFGVTVAARSMETSGSGIPFWRGSERCHATECDEHQGVVVFTRDDFEHLRVPPGHREGSWDAQARVFKIEGDPRSYPLLRIGKSLSLGQPGGQGTDTYCRIRCSNRDTLGRGP